MSYALDTNILVAILREKEPGLHERFLSHPPSAYTVSEVVRAELLHGVALSRNPKANGEKVQALLTPLTLIPFGGAAAESYAEIKTVLQQQGTPIGANDLLIAATALARNDILITRNTGEFARVPGLKIKEW